LKPAVVQGPLWLYFPEQWDAKSPWHDERVRLAASLAIDRKSINEALTLGYSRLPNSIIPDTFEFFWQPPAAAYDPAKAKELLAEAGYPKASTPATTTAIPRTRMSAKPCSTTCRRPASASGFGQSSGRAFIKGYAEKSFKNIIQGGSGAFGNAATRLEAFVVKGGTFVYGNYPDIDGLFQQQAVEMDRKRREAILHKIQELVYGRSIYAPIGNWPSSMVWARVGESGFG